MSAVIEAVPKTVRLSFAPQVKSLAESLLLKSPPTWRLEELVVIVPLCSKSPATEIANASATTPPVLINVFAVIVRLPSRSIVLLLVNVPSVETVKLLKLLNALKESLAWVKSAVRIKFKLSDETVPVFVISSAKFGTSIVTLSASIVPSLSKSSPAVTLKLFTLIVELLWLEKSLPAKTSKLSALIVEELLLKKWPPAVTLKLSALIVDEL